MNAVERNGSKKYRFTNSVFLLNRIHSERIFPTYIEPQAIIHCFAEFALKQLSCLQIHLTANIISDF